MKPSTFEDGLDVYADKNYLDAIIQITKNGEYTVPVKKVYTVKRGIRLFLIGWGSVNCAEPGDTITLTARKENNGASGFILQKNNIKPNSFYHNMTAKFGHIREIRATKS